MPTGISSKRGNLQVVTAEPTEIATSRPRGTLTTLDDMSGAFSTDCLRRVKINVPGRCLHLPSLEIGHCMVKEKQFDFKIIAGELKGKKIVTPDLGITRPPLSRLRKAIFDYLTPYLDGADYLDLFSGTGSYLFEAVSRGAHSGTGIELEPRLVNAINTQAAQFGVNDRLRCLTGDVFTTIPSLKQQDFRCDIIMIAPPQYQGIIDRTLKLLKDHAVLWPQGQIICQHDTSETGKIDWCAWRIQQQRKYGNTTFTICGK